MRAEFHRRRRHAVSLAKTHRTTIAGFLNLSMVRGTQILMGLVTTYFLARSLSVTQYGEYQFVLNVIGLLTVTTLTEFNNTLMQSIARGYTGSFRKVFPYPLIGSLGGSLVLIGFAVWYGWGQGHRELQACFLIAAVLFPLMHGLTLWRGLKLGGKRFFALAKIEMAGLIGSQLSIIAVAHFYGGHYVPVLLAFMGFPALLNLLMLYRLKFMLRDPAAAEYGILPHGIKSSAYASIFIVSNYVDKLLLFWFLNPAALALFTAGDRLTDLLKTAAQDITNALAPDFAKTEHYSAKLDKALKLFCLGFGALMMVFAFTLLPYAVRIIYGEKYAGAVPYAQVLIFAAAIGNLASMQFRYIRSKFDTDNFRRIIIWTSLARLAASIILIPLAGLKGAVLSALFYRAAMSLYINHVINTEYRKPEAVA